MSITNTRSNLSFLPFNQDINVIIHLDDRHKTLTRLRDKYQGLCELICNHILIKDLLGKGKSPGFLAKQITVKTLNEKMAKKSHILETYSIFRKALAYLFKIYPKNVFSLFEQHKLVKKTDDKIHKINKKILGNGLKKVANGEVLKVLLIEKHPLFKFEGHSLLVKKMGSDNYIFFDPNKGEYRNLTFNHLCKKLDNQLNNCKGKADLYFMRGKDYLKKNAALARRIE